MRKTSILLATAAVIIGMASCDKLKEPYIIEPAVAVSDTIALEAVDTLNFDGKVVVLLEDFTGVKCVNCPDAAAIASQLQAQNERHLVVMGVHPKDNLQSPSGGFPDFRTDDGDAWKNYFNISGYPKGLVNRASVIGSAEWSTAVNAVIGDDAPVRLIIKNEFDDATRELKLSIHAKFLADANGDIRLTVCMMEDSIVGKQVFPSPISLDTAYMHRHVFRGTADGITWGRALDNTATTIYAGRNFITNMKFTVDETYNAGQFYIVAFISNDDDKSVLMAAEKKIK